MNKVVDDLTAVVSKIKLGMHVNSSVVFSIFLNMYYK